MWSAKEPHQESPHYRCLRLPLESIQCRAASPSGILRASIEEFGILQPLVVARGGSQYVVLEGCQRFQVARDLGMREVPVVCVNLTEAKRRELVRWNPDLRSLATAASSQVAGILEEAVKRGLIAAEDVTRFEGLSELDVVAELRQVWQQSQSQE